jgi:hypothetical protein
MPVLPSTRGPLLCCGNTINCFCVMDANVGFTSIAYSNH